MANFDAMVPLIPKDTRVPVDQTQDQMRVNQIEKTKELQAISDEESTTIDNDPNREKQRQQQSSEQQQPESEVTQEESTEDSLDSNSGHIDTYA